MTTTTTSKTATNKKAAPAPVAEAPKKATRTDLLALLDKHKYAGPRSYTASMLSGIVEWLDAKAPKDKIDGVPSGVVFAVHPEMRPVAAPKAKTLSKNYLAALADVLNALDNGDDVREFVTVRLANGQVAA